MKGKLRKKGRRMTLCHEILTFPPRRTSAVLGKLFARLFLIFSHSLLIFLVLSAVFFVLQCLLTTRQGKERQEIPILLRNSSQFFPWVNCTGMEKTENKHKRHFSRFFICKGEQCGKKMYTTFGIFTICIGNPYLSFQYFDNVSKWS